MKPLFTFNFNLLKCCFVLLSLSSVYLSCSKKTFTSQYKDSNRVISEEYNYFNNDSLKVSIDFLGNTNVSSEEHLAYYKIAKKITKKHYPEIKLKKENFVLSEISDGSFFGSLYVYPKVKSHNAILYDTTGKNKCILYPFSSHDKTFVYITCNLGGAYEIFEHNARFLIPKIGVGENYKKAISKDPFSLNTIGDSVLNYLWTITIVNAAEKNYMTTKAEKGNYLQAALTFNSLIQNNKTWDTLITKLPTPKDTPVIIAKNEEAIKIIIDSCSTKNVVMLNESHWQPKCRYLGNILLTELYKQGFTYLAVEAVWEDQDTLNTRGYPAQSTGLYVTDPIFGNMMRHAQTLGYKIIRYDHFADGDRELNQASNIYNETIKKDTTAKVLVFAGFGHIDKDKNKRWMAARFKEVSGINPFVIDQTHMLYLKKDDSNPYQLALIQNPKPTSFDMMVVNNYSYPEIATIPEVANKEIKISLSGATIAKLKQHGNLLLSVYIEKEYEALKKEAVPVINYLIEDNKDITLKLAQNQVYTAIITTYTGSETQRINDI